MYERVLVPLDGSKVGEAALSHVEKLVARRIAGGLDVEITLFEVLPRTHYVAIASGATLVPYNEKELEEIKKETMDYLDKAGEGLRNKGATVKAIVETGSTAEMINKVADETNADLIAMSTHGRSGFSRLALGSVTDKVLRGGNIPVLVVRAPKEAEKP